MTAEHLARETETINHVRRRRSMFSAPGSVHNGEGASPLPATTRCRRSPSLLSFALFGFVGLSLFGGSRGTEVRGDNYTMRLSIGFMEMTGDGFIGAAGFP